MKQFIDAIHRAAASAEPHLTQDLQHNLLEEGWDPNTALRVTIHANEGKFEAHVPHSHSAAAFDEEYGTQEQPPKASLRNYGKSGSRAEKILLTSLAREVEGLL